MVIKEYSDIVQLNSEKSSIPTIKGYIMGVRHANLYDFPQMTKSMKMLKSKM